MLREELPASLPITVKRCKVSGESAGDCSKDGNRFIIRVDKDLSEDAAILVLMHEWSHSISWDSNFMPGDHHVIWGIAYAMVWKTWLANC
jgi:hypothetical protein